MRYQEKLKLLSDQLVAVQKPILILDSIKWPAHIRQTFIAAGAKQPPAVDADYYSRQTLGFDPARKKDELKQLKQDIENQLGKSDELGIILTNTVDQYRIVIEMLEQRGKPGFMQFSQQLYGSARDHMRGDSKTILELGERLCHIFSLPAAAHLTQPYPKKLSAVEAVNILQPKLRQYFSGPHCKVCLSDGIVSDASAGGDTIKINSQASFSELDLQVLEVHEGWVHVGTTMNGRAQPWATWLSVGSPRITATQEGLAILIETLTFSSYPDRARRISDRVIAIDQAEQGADFLQVYRYFIDNGLSEHDSYIIAQRTFRGGNVRGGSCFTKDISYVKGFVETVNFIRSAILSGVPEILPMLFVGKVSLDDIPTLFTKAEDGLIKRPAYLPSMFKDLNGLYTWFGFSSGMTLVDLTRVKEHFDALFKALPVKSEKTGLQQDVEFD